MRSLALTLPPSLIALLVATVVAYVVVLIAIVVVGGRHVRRAGRESGGER